jgi:hypothetical protein
MSQGTRKTVARSIEEVEALRAAWEAMSWEGPDPEIDYYLAVLRSRPDVAARPHVVRLEDGSSPGIMFVGRLEDTRLTTWVGYWRVHQPALRSITLVHGGVAGVETQAEASALVDELCACLARREADAVSLPSLRIDSPLYVAAASRPSFLRRQVPATRLRWRLRVPETFEEFVRSRSKKTRENTRLYRNRLLRDFEDVSVRVYRKPEDARLLFRELDRVAAKTYQRGLGVGFADTAEDRALTTLGLERGWFRAHVLYVRDTPIAFWPGFAYNRTFFVGTPGYDPQYAEYRVGTFLLLRVIEYLCSDDEVDVLDYGFGEADYKRRFGNECYQEGDVLVFAPTFRATRINLTRTGISSSVSLAKRGLAHTGLLGLVKQRWRRRLAANGQSSSVGLREPGVTRVQRTDERDTK